jgi:DNA polymerase-3 subunit epsilon
MARELVLDTETTGIDYRSGHRLIEIACIELEDFIPTGSSFHRYVHPERDIEAEAQAVHGISLDFLKDKPRFAEPEVCDEFLEFVRGDVIIAHNASFDRGFVNFELGRAGRPLVADARWIDTLARPRRAFRGCTIPWMRSASASRSPWPSGRSTAPLSTAGSWPQFISSSAAARSGGSISRRSRRPDR